MQPTKLTFEIALFSILEQCVGHYFEQHTMGCSLLQGRFFCLFGQLGQAKRGDFISIFTKCFVVATNFSIRCNDLVVGGRVRATYFYGQ